jgi:hypothetical protein
MRHFHRAPATPPLCKQPGVKLTTVCAVFVIRNRSRPRCLDGVEDDVIKSLLPVLLIDEVRLNFLIVSKITPFHDACPSIMSPTAAIRHTEHGRTWTTRAHVMMVSIAQRPRDTALARASCRMIRLSDAKPHTHRMK